MPDLKSQPPRSEQNALLQELQSVVEEQQTLMQERTTITHALRSYCLRVLQRRKKPSPAQLIRVNAWTTPLVAVASRMRELANRHDELAKLLAEKDGMGSGIAFPQGHVPDTY
jgi:hypothetical protein